MDYEQKHPISQEIKEQIDKDWSYILKETNPESYYEQKYKDALQMAKHALDCDRNNLVSTDVPLIYSMFPELKENENEYIRKRIIHALRGDVLDMEETIKAITWLKKQDDKTLNAELLTKVLTKHLYTCVNKTNTYVRSEEDHITLIELINKIKTDLNIE